MLAQPHGILLVTGPTGSGKTTTLYTALSKLNTPSVKIITVEPGHRLSLQRHGHRAEMWHVLDGPVDVTVGERRWSVAAGEDVWVPGGAVHRLGNSGDRTARLLEVAFGDFDEADIERLEDDYTRR